MAGRRARAHEDLLHARHFRGGGITAAKDLRVGAEDGSGIRPSVLQMLFRGGSVDRQHADEDTRMGRRESVKPRTSQALFSGGITADRDLRTGHDAGIEPDDREELAHGGEVFSAEEKLAAHEVLAALKTGDAIKFLKAMKGLVLLLDDDDGFGDDE